MTVEYLIKLLKQLDPEKEVFYGLDKTRLEFMKECENGYILLSGKDGIKVLHNK